VNSGDEIHPKQRYATASEGAFRVVIVCEDDRAESRAHQLVARLKHRHGDSMELVQGVWRFESLAASEVICRFAAMETRRADMVILAMDGSKLLPEAVQRLMVGSLERAIDEAFRARALVVLFEHPAERPEAASLRDYLRDLASRGGMDFFLHSSRHLAGSAAGLPAGEWMAFQRHGGGGAFDPHSPLASRWGINE
jgi:hypothetical protein